MTIVARIAALFTQLARIIRQATSKGVEQFEDDVAIAIRISRGRASHFDFGGHEEKIVRLIGLQFQARQSQKPQVGKGD